MSDDSDIPADARHALEASVAEFQAAVIDADVVDVGVDAAYVPEGPKRRGEFEGGETDA
jgi:hypothetical protein